MTIGSCAGFAVDIQRTRFMELWDQISRSVLECGSHLPLSGRHRRSKAADDCRTPRRFARLGGISPQGGLGGGLRFAGLLATLLAAQFAAGQPGTNQVVQAFDFTNPTDAARWSPTHDLAPLTLTSTGLLARITGEDPYMTGPARDYPAGKLLWLHLRLKSDQGGIGQVFYYTNYPTEPDSVKFFVPAGNWYETKVPMSALGPAWQLRIDPPGSGGTCLLGRLWFEERRLLEAPPWPKPAPPVIGSDALTLQSGDLALTHDAHTLGAFKLAVAGQPMAVGHTQPIIGYLAGSVQRWLSLGSATANPANVSLAGGRLRVLSRARDLDGAMWTVECLFSPTNSGAILVESRCSVDQDRQVVYLPLFTLLPGLGSFGTNKNQGLFCGLEYLENEPSSSEADITGPQSQRQVPDMLKVTVPLMALAAQERYVGLAWQPDANVSAVFDSPERAVRLRWAPHGSNLPGFGRPEPRRGPSGALLASPGAFECAGGSTGVHHRWSRAVGGACRPRVCRVVRPATLACLGSRRSGLF